LLYFAAVGLRGEPNSLARCRGCRLDGTMPRRISICRCLEPALHVREPLKPLGSSKEVALWRAWPRVGMPVRLGLRESGIGTAGAGP
jgi:hypothetical protein